MDAPGLIDIKLLQKSKLVEFTFDNGENFSLPCAYLRLFSPSADAKKERLKENIFILTDSNLNIIGIDPVGNYALKFIFNDGHNTGIYTFTYLYELACGYKKSN